VILLAAYASRTENQDAIDASVVQVRFPLQIRRVSLTSLCMCRPAATRLARVLGSSSSTLSRSTPRTSARRLRTARRRLVSIRSLILLLPCDFVVTSPSLPRMTSCAFPFLGSYFFVSFASLPPVLLWLVAWCSPVFHICSPPLPFARSLANARSPQANSSASPRA
jgi:hypothetical protein